MADLADKRQFYIGGAWVDPAQPKRILTVWRRGYRFVADPQADATQDKGEAS